MDLWRQVEGLSGTMLETVRGKRFDVSAVTAHSVIIRGASSGREYPVPRSEIECASMLEIAPENLRPIDVRSHGCSEYHPAYVVAIIRAVHGIR
jgi:hypothetical protein